MKSTLLTCVLSFVIIFSFAQANAPAVVNSTGGQWSSGYYQFEWSVGELALVNQMNTADSKLIVTNGFLQPYSKNFSAGNKRIAFADDEIKIFPNPASHYVEINVLTSEAGRLYVYFYDAVGQKLYTRGLSYIGLGCIETVPVHHLKNGTYMLIVELRSEGGKLEKKGMYKIIKVK